MRQPYAFFPRLFLGRIEEQDLFLEPAQYTCSVRAARLTRAAGLSLFRCGVVFLFVLPNFRDETATIFGPLSFSSYTAPLDIYRPRVKFYFLSLLVLLFFYVLTPGSILSNTRALLQLKCF